jgi:hypothetical protein
MDHKIDVTQQIYFNLLVSDPMKAVIFVNSGPYGAIIPLGCRVKKHEANSESAMDLILNSRIWEDVRLTPSKATTFQPDRLSSDRISYSIPELYMPSHDAIQRWALETLDSDPHGAIGEFHGELWIASTQYLQSGIRPLVSRKVSKQIRRLITLA